MLSLLRTRLHGYLTFPVWSVGFRVRKCFCPFWRTIFFLFSENSITQCFAYEKTKIKHKIRAIITIVNVTILMSVMLFFSFLLGVVFHISRKTRIYINDYIKLPIVQWGRKSLLLIDYDQNCNGIVGAYYDIQCTFSTPLKLILASIGRIISFFRKSIFALLYYFHLVFFRQIFGNWVYFMFVQVLYYYP